MNKPHRHHIIHSNNLEALLRFIWLYRDYVQGLNISITRDRGNGLNITEMIAIDKAESYTSDYKDCYVLIRCTSEEFENLINALGLIKVKNTRQNTDYRMDV